MEKKIRIQLYTNDGQLINDRLVSQDIELNTGPKESHIGPIRVEFSLLELSDIEKAKLYLDKLVGNLPLDVKVKKKKLDKEFEIVDRQAFIEELLGSTNNQDEFINDLRSKGFKFMMWDFLNTFQFPLEIKEVHKEKYQWMLRCIKEAKNPSVDKYDPTIIIGIQMYGERSPKIVIYIDGKFSSSYDVKLIEKSKLTFKKTEMMKFTTYMTEQEREKFRYEVRQYQLNPEKEQSKFFLRWKPYVENVPILPQDK